MPDHGTVRGHFLNARTGLFLPDRAVAHVALLPQAIARARADADAQASRILAPGRVVPKQNDALWRKSSLPVNGMRAAGAPRIMALAKLGVARISWGPFPWRAAMADLAARFQARTGAVGGQDAKKA